MIRLNLLPPEIKEQIDYSHKNAHLYQMLVQSLAVMFGVFACMFVIGFIVWNNRQIAEETRSDAYIQLSKLSQTETDAKDLNARLNLIDKIRKDKLNWTRIFTEIANSTPSGVRLTNFDFTNAVKDRVAFSGFASTAGDVGIYRQQLSKSALFQYVDVESLTASNDPIDKERDGFTFRITFNLNVQEAKKK